jgi:hypothetical protein
VIPSELEGVRLVKIMPGDAGIQAAHLVAGGEAVDE